jgi:hypothetical protein
MLSRPAEPALPGWSRPALVSVPVPTLIAPMPSMLPLFSRLALPVARVALFNSVIRPSLIGNALAVSTPSSTRSVPVLVSGIASVSAVGPRLTSRPALSIRPVVVCVTRASFSSTTLPPAAIARRAPLRRSA